MNDELPGMMALARGVAGQTWPHTVDAQVWVNEWFKNIADHPEVATDRGAMLGWFANAIMAGYDTACLRMPSNTITEANNAS